MKIIKAHKSIHNHYYLLVDEIPKITYEKVGNSYIGTDEQKLFNKYLHYNYCNSEPTAFGGRELKIQLKNGEQKTLKDHWWDAGIYDEENEYISVGLGTLEELQNCFVFCSYNINKNNLETLLEEYLKTDTFHEYYNIEKWTKLQYNWYPLIIDKKELPLLVNWKGDLIEKETKERICCQNGFYLRKKDKVFKINKFKFKYKTDERLIKVETNSRELMSSILPTEEFEKWKKIKYNYWRSF